MKIKVAAIQTKTFLEADEQKKNIEKAREYETRHSHGLAPF